MKAYKGQDITVAVDANTSISGTDVKMLYKKPNGVKGSWGGSISGTKIIVSLVNGEIDQAGLWRFQGRFLKSGATQPTYTHIETYDFGTPLDA